MRVAKRRATRRSPGRRPTGRSRVAQGEETRRAILRAAVELYADGGFRGTGLIAIGRRAGVHHATVLYHYRSARELLLAVLEERDRQLRELADELLQEGGLQGLARLPQVGRFNAEHPLWTRLFAVLQVENLDPRADAHAYFRKRRDDTHRLLVRVLRRAKKDGQIRADVDERATADVVQSFMTGVQIQHLLDPERVDQVAVYERFTAALLADLASGRTPRR